jgi:hypothetical protein
MTNVSPAMRHQARLVSARAAAIASPGESTRGSAYELMLYKLADDRRRLKQIQSIQKKIEVKATMLPEYRDWIDGVLSAGNGAQDDVVASLLVWHIDVGDYERALEIAEYAVKHKLTLPDQYSRDIPTMLIDEFSVAYLNGPLFTDPEKAIAILDRIEAMTQNADTPDQAKAKLHKAIGYALIATVDKADPVEITLNQRASASRASMHFAQALGLFEHVGVKKDIERLDRRLKKAAAA